MQILILEDEEQALKRLQKIILEVVPDAVLIGATPSVEETISWFEHNTMPDLIFMDIQLADGNSLQLFNKIKISCPVIFTTAHENYALEAFKVNSVDYLLKPIDKTDVKRAIDKLRLLQSSRSFVADYAEILKTIQPPSKKYKDRFIIKIGDTIKSLSIGDIAYFYTENKSNFVCTNDGKRYPMDFNLDQTEQLLNPKNFFRINRQFIIGHHAIEEMKAHTRSRIIVRLNPPSRLDTVVAIDRAQDFRSWLSE
ncbi:LytR/AlgR family response regulator transcription factor [Ferruginibacter profundus]